MAPDTYTPSVNCRGRILDFSVPRIMGILNVTPDSFFDGGRFHDAAASLRHVGEMLKRGADIIDVGGCSARPGSEPVSEQVEINRVVPVIKLIHKKFPEALISIDTFRSRVARLAVDAGASVINDISGGGADKSMFRTAAGLKTPYILMHMKGIPSSMQNNPAYRNLMKEMICWFKKRIFMLRKAGVSDIIIDPGFGFGKTVSHNYGILKRLNDFRIFGLPVMAGFSRKSMVSKVLGVTPDDALNGTSVLNTIALLNGATMLRVHDVKEAMEAVSLYLQYRSG